MDNIINQDGPDQYSIPKIDAWEAGTATADNTMYAIRAGVGRVKTNQYRGRCLKCNEWVPARQGILTMQPGPRFKVSHKEGGCSV